MYMSSPVLSGDLLFGLSIHKRGQLICLNPATGATLWKSEGRLADSAAIVSAGSVLLLLTTDADLIVFRNSDKAFELVRKYSVAGSPTWAHPVILGHAILIKDATTLALWDTQ
jgi:outer membrane protein assembly factor BamB